MMIGAMYSEAMMTIMDNMSDPMICHKMKYVEFLVFLCRVTFEHYEKTEHNAEPFYNKLDHMMPKFLDHMRLEPVFTFGVLFAAELKQAVKQFIRAKKKYML